VKIVFAMIETGGGHRAPARAVMEALERASPGRHHMRLMDFMKDLGCADLDARHKREWDRLLAHPRATKAGYHFINLGPRITSEVVRHIYVRPFVPFVERFLETEKPDLLFCTHFLSAMAGIEAKRRTGSPCRVVTFCSDAFGVHAFWDFMGSDLYIVASERARAGLLKWGHPPDTVEIHPYPLPPSFLDGRRPTLVVRRELGLSPDRPTLLISFGGQGIGDVGRYLAALEDAAVALNVIVVAGKNEALQAQLDAAWASREGCLRVIPLGYVTNMNELLEASDLCFIKPGVAATMEALALRTPIIFWEHATPSEIWNIQHAVGLGVGFRAGRSVRRFVEACRVLTAERTRAEVMRRFDAFHFDNGAEQIARRLDRLLAPASRPDPGPGHRYR
jgi:processive 1,2-diacylglycerol beta-glucosyltransferase